MKHRAKLDGAEPITALQGDARDLSCFDDNTFDLTMLLGPMYHLYTKEEKLRALSEAVRVTKVGGVNKPIGLLRYNLFWDNTPFCTLLLLRSNTKNKVLDAL